MGIILTATEEELLEPGIYRVKLAGTEAKAGTVKETMPDGTVQSSPSTYIRWTFEITEEGYEEAMPLRANSSQAFGSQSKARNWAEVLLRRPIEKGEQFNLDDLVGQEALASIKHKVVGDKTYSEIESLAPIRKGKKAAKPEPEEDEDVEF